MNTFGHQIVYLMLYLRLVRWVPSRELSNVGCFPELFFSDFLSVGACWIALVVYKTKIFLTRACTLNFNNNKNNNNVFLQYFPNIQVKTIFSCFEQQVLIKLGVENFILFRAQQDRMIQRNTQSKRRHERIAIQDIILYIKHDIYSIIHYYINFL